MDSRIIDVAIGLALVFAITSLLASAVIEAVSSFGKRRGRVLKSAIVSFLGDDEAFAKVVLKHPLIVSLAPATRDTDARKPSYITPDVMITSLLSHLITKFSGGVRPSSPAELVSSVMAGGIPNQPPPALGDVDDAQPNVEFKKGLASLLMGVENDWPAFEKRLTAWYCAVGERSIGWFKRRTQVYLAVAGFATAAAFNINPIVIAPALWNDAALREAMVEAGVSASKTYAESTASASGAANTVTAADDAAAGTSSVTNAGAAPSTAAIPPSLVKAEPVRVRAADDTARHYAVFHHALIDAAKEAAAWPGATGSSELMESLDLEEEIPEKLTRMRTPDDGTMASKDAREDGHAAVVSLLNRLETLLEKLVDLESPGSSESLYAKARDARTALADSVKLEMEALRRASATRSRNCSQQEDPAARNLCLRLGDLEQLEEMGLPIGWSGAVWPTYGKNYSSGVPLEDGTVNWLIVVLGWLITAVGTTLGAPFWFDALSKFARIRGAGPKGDTSGTSAEAPRPTTTDTSATTATTSAVAGKEAMSDALNAFELPLSSLDVQRLQRGLGMTDAQLTGFFDANTRVAIRNWQQTQGAEATGELTQPQIEQLSGIGQTAGDDTYTG